jgi:Uma2 family endonuclease
MATSIIIVLTLSNWAECSIEEVLKMTMIQTLPSPVAEDTILATHFKYWTVKEYHHMSELGILDSSERTELITGKIVLMTAKGTPHVIALQLIASSLQAQLNNIALIRTQDPIELDDFSEPEPDLAIVKGKILDYADRHPGPSDVLLVVEIADSTLKKDCEVKDKLYARSNIADYWVIDVKNRQVHIFRTPTPTGYASHLILSDSQTVSPLAFPEIVLLIASILPPVGEWGD